jgi:uncharacterized membrane protein YjfL (UPF0719 family)
MKSKITALLALICWSIPLMAEEKVFSIEAIERGLVGTIVYSLVGILMAVLAFKIIDLVLPGKMTHQITEDRNVAVALVASSLILGVCIIIAAAIIG